MKSETKILVLWSRPSGYMDACLNELARKNNTKVLFIGEKPDKGEAPFDLSKMTDTYQPIYFKKPIDQLKLLGVAEEFKPDIILSGGSWREPAYRRLLREFRSRACRVLCMDTQWESHFHQYVAMTAIRFLKNFLYDKAFVAGDRQAEYAKRIGFKKSDITTGLYSCNLEVFKEASKSVGNYRFASPSFLFVGRLIKIKGIRELIEGYDLYRSSTQNPFPLSVCGVGPLSSMVRAAQGVNYLGFVQPDTLPEIMARHAILIAPSHSEPWGVVLHEATSAGMSVICSQKCGAGDSFVRDGQNGFILPEITPEAICDALKKFSKFSEKALATMSSFSKKIATVNSPSIWAENVLNFAAQRNKFL